MTTHTTKSGVEYQLFKATVVTEIIVVAASDKDATSTALSEDVLSDAVLGQGFVLGKLETVSSLDQLPEGWSGDSYPHISNKLVESDDGYEIISLTINDFLE